MTGTAASYTPPRVAVTVVMPTGIVNLQPTPSGQWTDTTLQAALPSAGRWKLDADVRAALSATVPNNTWIAARLFNVTAGVPVPETERIINQLIDTPGQNNTGPLTAVIDVPGPTVIRVQAQRSGVSATAGIYSDTSGRSALTYERIS